MLQSILPALISIIPVALIVAFVIVTTIDMNKACVQIDGDTITVVDYYFFSKKELINCPETNDFFSKYCEIQ